MAGYGFGLGKKGVGGGGGTAQSVFLWATQNLIRLDLLGTQQINSILNLKIWIFLWCNVGVKLILFCNQSEVGKKEIECFLLQIVCQNPGPLFLTNT